MHPVHYLKEEEIAAVERNLKNSLSGNVKLFVEQIQVQAGGLREELKIAPALQPAPPPPPPRGETLQAA